jgi:pectate lyase
MRLTSVLRSVLAAIDTVGPLIIQVRGTINITSKQGVRPNKTIVGLGTSAVINGGGLDFHRSFNVIVRNLRFTNAEDDSVNIGQNSHHIWIDHNEFSGALDGSVDIVRGTCEVAGTVTEPRTFYPYTLDSAAGVPAIVRAGVGVGRI